MSSFERNFHHWLHILTTSGAANDENFTKMTTFQFRCSTGRVHGSDDVWCFPTLAYSVLGVAPINLAASNRGRQHQYHPSHTDIQQTHTANIFPHCWPPLYGETTFVISCNISESSWCQISVSLLVALGECWLWKFPEPSVTRKLALWWLSVFNHPCNMVEVIQWITLVPNKPIWDWLPPLNIHIVINQSAMGQGWF